MTSLAEILQRVSTAAYQAASTGGPDGTDGTGEGASSNGYEAPEGADGDAGAPEGETVEGEFKEV
jgi:hypothetical protein